MCRKKIQRDFHMGHPERKRTKSLMRFYVYWPRTKQTLLIHVKDAHSQLKRQQLRAKRGQKCSNRGKGLMSTSEVLWMTSTTSFSSTATQNGRKFQNAKGLRQIAR